WASARRASVSPSRPISSAPRVLGCLSARMRKSSWSPRTAGGTGKANRVHPAVPEQAAQGEEVLVGHARRGDDTQRLGGASEEVGDDTDRLVPATVAGLGSGTAGGARPARSVSDA